MIKSAGCGIQLMVRALTELQAGRALPSTAQDPTKISFARLPRADVLEIHWDQNAERILALIRAASPYFGAFTIFRKLMLKVWSARISRPNTSAMKPGTVVVSGGTTEVAARDCCLQLEVVQLEGMRFYSGNQFATTNGLQDGQTLGRA